MSQIMSGRKLRDEKINQFAQVVKTYKQQGRRAPHLAVVLVGEDPASMTYVRNKQRACKRAGFTSSKYELDKDTTQAKLNALIDHLNEDDDVDGILVQFPIPAHLSQQETIERIFPTKDVDGLHPRNVAALTLNKKGIIPCTPKGIVELLKKHEVEMSGKLAVVIGRSSLVGRPAAQLMSNEDSTIVLCHSKTENLKALTRMADILIVAMGQPLYITADYVKEGVVLVDVGIHQINDRIVGDCDPSAYEKASRYTPVPGGVGPMTIASLLENTLEAYEANDVQ